ncbi:MAG: hypothetical protein WA708_00015 [Acidobacteriaceae bacterium]
MKISKWIELPGQEIEIEIDGNDAANAILNGSDDWTPEQLVRRVCNNFLSVFQKLPDAAIAAQTPEVRKIVADVMEAQAARFRQEFPR